MKMNCVIKMDGYSVKDKIETHLYEPKDFGLDKDSLKLAKELEKEYYYEVLDRVIANPRFYLDNLDKLDVFRVSFLNMNHKKEKLIK